MKLGYEKTLEMKIVRTKHSVTFKSGTSVCDLQNYLENLDDDAIVDEIIYDEDSGCCRIVFHQENKVE